MYFFNNKNFYKFLIPSLLGIFLFVTPIKDKQNFTIPVAIMANKLLDIIENYSISIIYILISISFLLTVLHKIFNLKFIRNKENIDKLFSPNNFWFIIRIIGFIFATFLYFDIGPDFIIGNNTGGLVINELMPILVCVFFLAGILLPLLLNFGLLDFFGALLIRIMRPVFNLPGRSAIDCVASWLGDGSIGVLLTSKQYEEGYYTRREATVIATTFSAVSITFSIVVISEVGLEHMFIPFYGTVAFAGIIAAIIVPKIPPLSKIPDDFNNKKVFIEDIPKGYTPIKWGIKKAIEKAEKSENIKSFFIEGFENVFDMWFGTLPVILAFGTIALIIAEYTPIFSIIGMPFIPIYKLLGIPEAVEASKTVIVGFADMFLPSVMANTIESDMTRFIISATSVTQLIYMSEIGSIIMGSKIPVSFFNLFIIFIERTLITLPIISIIAHILF